MGIEKPYDKPPDIPGEMESPNSLEETAKETEETNAEKGGSFLQRARKKIMEGVKTYFSVPNEGKIINIMEKVGGAAHLALWSKVAIDQRLNTIVPANEQGQLALAAAAIACLGFLPIMHALDRQHREKEKRETQ